MYTLSVVARSLSLDAQKPQLKESGSRGDIAF